MLERQTASAVVSYHLLVLKGKIRASMLRLVNGPQPTVQDIELEILRIICCHWRRATLVLQLGGYSCSLQVRALT